MISAGTRVAVYVEKPNGVTTLYGKLTSNYSGYSDAPIEIANNGSKSIVPAGRILYVEDRHGL